MITLILLLAKVFIFGIPCFLLIGFVNVILTNLSKLFSIQKCLALFYSIIVTIVFIYIYSFWGAYLNSIVEIYSEIYDEKWLLIILCFLSIFPWLKFVNKQLKEERMKMNKMTSYSFFPNTSNHEDYMQSITVIAFSMSIFLPVSFIVFLFTDTLHNTLFFSLPHYFSGLLI